MAAAPRCRHRSRGVPGLARWLVCALAALLCGCGDARGARAAGVDAPDVSFSLGDGPSAPLHPVAVLPASAGSVDLVGALLPAERVRALPAQALRYSGLRDGASPHLALPTFAVYESERVFDHEPDLVLAHTWQNADTTARLREQGIPVAVLTDVNRWSAIRRQVLDVGRLLDAENEAERLVRGYDQRLEALAASLAGRRRPTALCYTNGGAGGWVAGAETTNDVALSMAGLRNLASEAGRTGHEPISFEELLMLDPEILVVGGQAEVQRPGGTAELLRTAEALRGLQAVRNDRILVLDAWLYTTTSHHVVDAAIELARLAEPFRGEGP